MTNYCCVSKHDANGDLHLVLENTVSFRAFNNVLLQTNLIRVITSGYR